MAGPYAPLHELEAPESGLWYILGRTAFETPRWMSSLHQTIHSAFTINVLSHSSFLVMILTLEGPALLIALILTSLALAAYTGYQCRQSLDIYNHLAQVKRMKRELERVATNQHTSPNPKQGSSALPPAHHPNVILNGILTCFYWCYDTIRAIYPFLIAISVMMTTFYFLHQLLTPLLVFFTLAPASFALPPYLGLAIILACGIFAYFTESYNITQQDALSEFASTATADFERHETIIKENQASSLPAQTDPNSNSNIVESAYNNVNRKTVILNEQAQYQTGPWTLGAYHTFGVCGCLISSFTIASSYGYGIPLFLQYVGLPGLLPITMNFTICIAIGLVTAICLVYSQLTFYSKNLEARENLVKFDYLYRFYEFKQNEILKLATIQAAPGFT